MLTKYALPVLFPAHTDPGTALPQQGACAHMFALSGLPITVPWDVQREAGATLDSQGVRDTTLQKGQEEQDKEKEAEEVGGLQAGMRPALALGTTKLEDPDSGELWIWAKRTLLPDLAAAAAAAAEAAEAG
eukprot:scaffold64282_cov18-Tisochrysis_lutea.AAC.2